MLCLVFDLITFLRRSFQNWYKIRTMPIDLDTKEAQIFQLISECREYRQSPLFSVPFMVQQKLFSVLYFLVGFFHLFQHTGFGNIV